MAETSIVTLDLNFQGLPQAIATYLIRHRDTAVLVECGPGSTLEALRAGLAANGLSPRDVTHVLLTHIHLDHAGAAGWMAAQGAKILVHPVGAPHLQNPEKLLRSAQRIYGDQMDALWGDFRPVPESSLQVPSDGEEGHHCCNLAPCIDAPPEPSKDQNKTQACTCLQDERPCPGDSIEHSRNDNRYCHDNESRDA